MATEQTTVNDVLNHPSVKASLRIKAETRWRRIFRDWLWFMAGMVMAGGVGTWLIETVRSACHV
jgi:hypothetical protein